MPYWLSLLADLSARDHQPGAARADPRRRPRRRARPRRRVVAARGDADACRLRRRAGRASHACAPRRSWPPAHGSVALLRRCERDLGTAAFASAPGVPPTDSTPPRGPNAARTPRLLPSACTGPHHAPEGGTMTTSTATTTAAVRGAGRRPARRPDHAGRSRLRPGPRRVQRHDRQAPGGHRPLPRHRRRHHLRAVRPRARPRDRRPRRRPQCRRLRSVGRRPGHRPVAAAQHHGQPRRTTPSAPTPAAPGETSTTPPWRSAWPPPPASWPRPAWPA